MELGSTTVEGLFKVFDSKGSWDFLFGKRLMTAFPVVHDYAADEVFTPSNQLMMQQQQQACYEPKAQHGEIGNRA